MSFTTSAGGFNCNEFDVSDLEETPTIVEFENTRIIERVHYNTPRFGKTSDINDLLFGSNEEQKDYVMGVFASSIAIFAFFTCWFVLLMIFRCCGPNRVGMLSGKQRPGSADVSGNNNSLLLCSRITVLLCSLGITICVLILVTKGVRNLSGASEDTTGGIEDGQRLARLAIQLIDDFLVRQALTKTATTQLLDDINTDFCPAVRPTLCTDTSNVATCNFDGIPYGDEISQLVGADDTIVLDQAMSTRQDVQELLNNLDTVHEKSTDFNWAFVLADVFGILTMLLCWVISFGVITSWRGHSGPRCIKILRHWLFIPLFVFLVLLGLIFSMVFIVGNVIASDACVNSPDGLVERFLESNDSYSDSPVTKLLLFYIRGCPTDDTPSEIREQVFDVLEVFQDVVAFAAQLKTASDSELQTICGTEDLTFLRNVAITLETTVCNLALTLADIHSFFSCDNWRPLYTTVVYDAACYQANDGFYFVTSTQFSIVCFAMIMLTCRVAFSPSNEETESPTKTPNGQVEEPVHGTAAKNESPHELM